MLLLRGARREQDIYVGSLLPKHWVRLPLSTGLWLMAMDLGQQRTLSQRMPHHLPFVSPVNQNLPSLLAVKWQMSSHQLIIQYAAYHSAQLADPQAAYIECSYFY